MALLNRLSHLLSADIHAVLDIVEEPQALLKQSLREMQDEMNKQQQQFSSLQQQEQQKCAFLEQQLAQLNHVKKDLDLCLKKDNQKLVRVLITKKLTLEKSCQTQQEQHQTLLKNIQNLEKQLSKNKLLYQSIQEQSRQLLKTNSNAFDEDRSMDGVHISEDEIELELLKLMNRGEK